MEMPDASPETPSCRSRHERWVPTPQGRLAKWARNDRTMFCGWMKPVGADEYVMTLCDLSFGAFRSKKGKAKAGAGPGRVQVHVIPVSS